GAEQRAARAARRTAREKPVAHSRSGRRKSFRGGAGRNFLGINANRGYNSFIAATHCTTGVLLMRHRRIFSYFTLAALPVLAVAGCRKEPEVKAPPKPAGPPKVSAEILQNHEPSGAGAVMVIMYPR